MNHSWRRLIAGGLLGAALGCAGTAEGPAEAPAPLEPDVVARIGDYAITLDEVDVKAKQADIKPYQALYDVRKQALEIMLTDHLLETEAQDRGITRQDLIDQEVNRKMQAPTAEQVQRFYEQNKTAMRGRPFEEMSAQIHNHLTSQSRQRAMRDLLSFLRTKYGVEVSLELPRVPVTIAANDPTKGPAGAPVQILEFSDFQ